MIDRQTVYEGRRISVQRCQTAVRGVTQHWDVVRHPCAVTILPLLPGDEIVLIHNTRIAVAEELLEAPAGCIDAGEAPDVAAARELAEETGYRAGTLAPLCTFYTSPGIMTEKMYAFIATGLTPGATAHESDEQIRVTTMPLDAALDGIRTGRIIDAKTIVALLHYDRFVRHAGDAE